MSHYNLGVEKKSHIVEDITRNWLEMLGNTYTSCFHCGKKIKVMCLEQHVRKHKHISGLLP